MYIYKLIKGIQFRPGMYINPVTIESIENFINGYIMGASSDKERESPPFELFSLWLKNNFGFDKDTAFHSWKYYIKCLADEESPINKFFELIDDYRKVESIETQNIIIGKLKITIDNYTNSLLGYYVQRVDKNGSRMTFTLDSELELFDYLKLKEQEQGVPPQKPKD